MSFLYHIFFQVLYVLCFTRPRYQVSVYRTIGPLVFRKLLEKFLNRLVRVNEQNLKCQYKRSILSYDKIVI